MVLALSMAGTLGRDAGRLVEDVLSRCSAQSGREVTIRHRTLDAEVTKMAGGELTPLPLLSLPKARQRSPDKATSTGKEHGKAFHSCFISGDDTSDTDEMLLDHQLPLPSLMQFNIQRSPMALGLKEYQPPQSLALCPPVSEKATYPSTDRSGGDWPEH